MHCIVVHCEEDVGGGGYAAYWKRRCARCGRLGRNSLAVLISWLCGGVREYLLALSCCSVGVLAVSATGYLWSRDLRAFEYASRDTTLILSASGIDYVVYSISGRHRRAQECLRCVG